jgi:Zn-dependent protease with chaperone function/type II secretory pathway pseudopilin PulG
MWVAKCANERPFMTQLVYPPERTLGTVTLVLGSLVWLGLLIGTMGMALVVGVLIYLFLQSALVAHIRGNAVELSETQFADLHAQFVACCEKLHLEERPHAYVLNGNGGLSAFAAKFLKAEFVVLLSDVVDAMDKHPDGVRFYIGRQLGQLRAKHFRTQLLRWPVLWLPLLGAAYSRARETTSDRYGLACCASPEGAVRALAALSVGAQRWAQLDVAKYVRQIKHTAGFWMSFHELTAGRPWLSKRAARLMHPDARMPQRNMLAYVVAAFIPYAGRLGGGFGFLIVVYIMGVLAATALPAYRDHVGKTQVSAAMFASQGTREALAGYYQTHKRVPQSLSSLGLPSGLPDGSALSLDAEKMVLTFSTRQGELVFVPRVDAQGRVSWSCSGGQNMRPAVLPAACQR